MGELLEKMEHAAHAGGGHGDHGSGNTGKLIGITMAMLGVMLAFCAAMVGSARTELIATMVEQSNTENSYEASRSKHRMMMAQLEMLHAITPSRAELAKFETELKGVHSKSGKEDTEDTAEIKAAIDLSTRAIVDILTPDPEDEIHFVKLIRKYEKEADLSHEWAEAYDEVIEGHFAAAEHYEWAQLASEVGIVIASIALLVGSRAVWGVSVVFGVGCAGVILWTYLGTRSHIHHGEEDVAKRKSAVMELRKQDATNKDDEKTLEGIEHGLVNHGGHGAGSGEPHAPSAPSSSAVPAGSVAPAHSSAAPSAPPAHPPGH